MNATNYGNRNKSLHLKNSLTSKINITKLTQKTVQKIKYNFVFLSFFYQKVTAFSSPLNMLSVYLRSTVLCLPVEGSYLLNSIFLNHKKHRLNKRMKHKHIDTLKKICTYISNCIWVCVYVWVCVSVSVCVCVCVQIWLTAGDYWYLLENFNEIFPFTGSQCLTG